MDLKRAWHSLRLYTMFNSKKRGDYVRRHNLFKYCGENVRLPQMLLPLYSDLITVHDNVEIASGVRLITHDAIHGVWNHMPNAKIQYPEHKGEIEIGDNVFIGANALLIGPVSIGSNCVIAAGAVVNHNIPEGCVAAGVPACVIGRLDELMEKRKPVNTN